MRIQRGQSLMLLFTVGLGCGGALAPAGPDQGAGNCFYGPNGIASVPQPPNACMTVPRPSFCATNPVCPGQSVDGNTRALNMPEECSCRDALFPELLDIGAQKQRLLDRIPSELFPGCKDSRCQTEGGCNWFLVEPRRCFQLGFINGFIMNTPETLGGNTHDGDRDIDVCPIGQESFNPLMGELPAMTMGAQGVLADKDVRRPIDIRAAFTPNSLHTEVIWCRWYGGPITIAADPPPTGQPKVTNHSAEVRFDSFLPQRGQRLSLVGDWMTDIGVPDVWGNGGGSHSEIHEIRFGATVKSDRRIVPAPPNAPPGPIEANCDIATNYGCALPDTWHILASGFFAQDTAQQDRLSITVPIPGPTNPLLNQPIPTMPNLTEGGCGGNDDDGTLSNYSCDGPSQTCTIVVERGSAAAPPRDCGSESCPCSNRDGDEFKPKLCTAKQIASYTDFDQCKPLGGRSQIAFARDIRVDWVDPLDLWNCECECDDPSAPGAVIRARVQGCAVPGPDQDSEPEARREACEQACGGVMCGGAPNCRIDTCRIQTVGNPASDQVAQMACEPPAPNQRVAWAGDYRVEIDAERSTLGVGDMGPDLVLVEKGHTKPTGTIWFNQTNATPPRLDIADMRLYAEDFKITGFLGLSTISVTNPRMFILNRMPADFEQDGRTFTVAPFQVKLGARARIDGKPPGGSEFINEGPLRGSVDYAAGIFSLDGAGRNADGRGVVFHLEGHIMNRPPSADPGPDRVVECESPTTTSVTLTGAASSDGDPGDSITHYQWFSGSAGLANQVSVTVGAPLGDNRYRLHVYDKDLASNSREQSIQVVDTTPPQFSLDRDEWCLWPPNHAFALFNLGQEITYTATDRCDAQAPTVSLVKVESCVLGPTGAEECGVGEAVDSLGSGSTSPDVRFGTSAGCVRSERTGSGSGRVYRATIQALDSHNNAVRRQIRIIVPHDISGHPNCIRAQGVDETDARCER